MENTQRGSTADGIALSYFTEFVRPSHVTEDGGSSRDGFPRNRGWSVGARLGGGRCGGTEERESGEGEKDLDELHDAVILLVRFLLGFPPIL